MTKRKPHAKPAGPKLGLAGRVALGCFIGSFVFFPLGALAHHLNSRIVADVFAMLTLVSFGQFFCWATIHSADTSGVIYSSRRRSLLEDRENFVRARRASQPIRYWALASLFLLFGFGVSIAGVYYIVSQRMG